MTVTRAVPSEDPRAIALAWERAYGRFDEIDAIALHVRARRALGRVLAWLDERGIDALPVKGIVLANTVYARPVERPLGDLDLKVRARDLDAIARLLATERGARLVRHSRIAGNVTGQIDLIEVDFETRIGAPLVCALGIDAIFARATRTRDGLGFEHLRIDVNDHALVLALDRFKDHVGAKPWAAWDLARIVREPGFTPSRFAERAAEARCTTIVHVVARHLSEAHGDARWGEIAARVPPARARYAERMLATLASGGPAALAARVNARAASDSPIRALASVAVGAAWALGGFGSVARRE